MDHLLSINKEQRIQKFKETGNTNYILKNKTFDIAKDPKYDGYQKGLASMVYKFFDKKIVGSGAKHVNTKITPQNQQLAEELHKPIIMCY